MVSLASDYRASSANSLRQRTCPTVFGARTFHKQDVQGRGYMPFVDVRRTWIAGVELYWFDRYCTEIKFSEKKWKIQENAHAMSIWTALREGMKCWCLHKDATTTNRYFGLVWVQLWREPCCICTPKMSIRFIVRLRSAVGNRKSLWPCIKLRLKIHRTTWSKLRNLGLL